MLSPSQVEAIFFAALDMKTEAERSLYLDYACGDDAELRGRVERLLEAHPKAADFLAQPALERHGLDPLDPAEGTERVAGSKPAAGGGGASSGNPVPLETLADSRDEDDDDNALVVLQPSEQPGSLGRLGHYEILEVLGKGSFGTVVKGLDEKLRRFAAIKLMSPLLAATSAPRKRFLREARSAAAVRHQNVVAIYAVEDKPTPYLVMEYIAGQTLQERLDATGPLDLPDVTRLGRQIAEGLAAAHATGLIHRDIKPSNILLEHGIEHVKITDFGLARAADDASISRSGLIAGTPMYMAPEQARGESIDHRADLFSLGSVLYTMCTGRPPFRAANTMAVLKRVTEDTPRPIREIIPEVPEWLCDLIARLHAKDPAGRFTSAQEVADVLAQHAAESQRSSGPRTAAGVETEVFQPGPKTKPVIRRPGFRKRGWLAAAAVLLVLFGCLGFTEATGVTDFRGTVIRLFSPEGTLVVEVDDPEVSVKVDGSDIVITGAGAREIRLKPGHYTVEASKNGKLVRQELVNVTRDGRPVVRITREAPEGTKVAGANANVPVRDRPEAVPPTGKEITNSIAMKLVPIPAGEFLMGSPDSDKDAQDDEKPQHRVRITRPFYLGATEVTVGQFRRVVEAAGYKTEAERNGQGGSHWSAETRKWVQDSGHTWRNPGFAQTDEHPVVQVTWNDAIAYCNLLNEREGLKPFEGYRLPTEAEWEYACRAGSSTLYSFDDDAVRLGEFAWHRENSSGQTHPVGRKRPNAWNLYDMHGNVWEWCQDWYDENYYGQSPVADPASPPDGDSMTDRGGSWQTSAGRCRQAFRGHRFRWEAYSDQGFRLARGPSGPEVAAPDPAAWEASVAAMPAVRQVKTVASRLKELNPGFDGRVIPTFEKGMVTGLKFATDHVTDLSPVRALTSLRSLDCDSNSYPGELSDLTPLRGLPLTSLRCLGNPGIFDLSPLQGMPLETLNCSSTGVFDLAPLQGMPLTVLVCGNTKVSELSPLKGMRLHELQTQGCPVSDLTPLRGMPLTSLDLASHRTRVTDLQPLQGMPLEYLNVARFPVSDLSVLKGMTSLRRLVLTDMKLLSDLTPLMGLPLTELCINGSSVSDLSPLKDMPLDMIRLTPRDITQGLEILRDMKSLKTISIAPYQDRCPVAEFWARYDRGEFK